jgi:glycerol-3-phosphate dehydrogenase subunit C
MQETNISTANLEQCLKCNLCTLVCPMLAVNEQYPGPKKAGPDGERYRIKDPDYYDYALKYCLNCKRCEVACPSGVKIGDMIQTARIKYGSQAKVRSLKGLRDWTLASTDFVGGMTAAPVIAPIANGVLKTGVAKAVLHGTIGVDKHRTFPAYSSQKFETWFRKNAEKDQAGFEKAVNFYHGCYANYNYPQLGKDFVKVINAAGYGVKLLEKEKCCGIALMSNGFAAKAARQGSINLDSIRKAEGPVLTVSSSCTHMMREEYPEVLGLPNEDVKDRIMLLTRWLYPKLQSGEIKLNFRKDFRMNVAYHTACHMQRMGWQEFTLGILRMIPGVELTALEPYCCGISGTFGFKKENYKYSQEIGELLFKEIRGAKAAADPSVPFVVATECETCKWQIEMSTGISVMNPVSIIAQALA